MEDEHPSCAGALSDGARTAPALTELERTILAFERGGWRRHDRKDDAIAETFGFPAAHYYSLLDGLIDRREALEADSLLVRRLRHARRLRRPPGGWPQSPGA